MNLKKIAFTGVKWTTLGTIGRSVFQLLQIAVLTRFLPKEAFGLVAMALFVIQFSNIFVDMGMVSAILHRQEATKKEYSSIFWFNIFVSLLLYLILLSFTPFIAQFYEEPELKILVPILGINLIITAIGRQHRTILQKQFYFKNITLTELFSFFIGLITAIVLAVNDFGVYSLVYSTLTASLIANLMFLLQNIRLNPIALHFSLKETYPFLKVGGFTMGSALLDFFSRETDILIIGKMLGAESLGLYSLSKQLVLKLYGLINPILISVLNPILSSLQKEKEKLKLYYLKVIYILATINFPVYLIVVVISKEILEVVYGNEYVSGYIVLSFLAIAYAINSLGNPVGSLQIATGRTDIGFKWTIFRIAITPLVLLIAAKFSLNILAMSFAILTVLLTFPAWRIMLYTMANIGLKEYLIQFWKPLLIFIILSLCNIYFNKYFDDYIIIVRIVTKTFFTFLIYFFFLFLIDKFRLKELTKLLNDLLIKKN